MSGTLENDQKHIWVIGYDDFHMEYIHKAAERRKDIVVHGLVPTNEVRSANDYSTTKLLTRCEHALASTQYPVDGITGYLDFPVSTLLPILRRQFNLAGASLEASLKCEDKYWSRLCQWESVPEHTPRFTSFNPHSIDPFKIDPEKDMGMYYPFWVKPRKSVSSYLAFRIDSAEHFAQALKEIKANIGDLNAPFRDITARATLPEEIKNLDRDNPDLCMAEESIFASNQCTLEGYADEDGVVIYAVVDSVHDPRSGSSFSHYLYPAPGRNYSPEVIEKMKEISREFIEYIEFTGPFNAEFFVDEKTGRISLLEVNTRVSKSHFDLLEKVDGVSHADVMLDCALGSTPQRPYREGEFAYAAKFMPRVYSDGQVVAMPNKKTIDRVARENEAGMRFKPHVKVSSKKPLSAQLQRQDSKSFEVADLFIGGRSPRHLENVLYPRIMNALGMKFTITATAPFQVLSEDDLDDLPEPTVCNRIDHDGGIHNQQEKDFRDLPGPGEE